MFTTQTLGKLMGLVWMVMVARYLGDVSFGRFSFALAFTTLFGLALDCGLSNLTIREVARDRSAASLYFNNILTLRLSLSLVVLALMVLVVSLMGYERETRQLVLIVGFGMVLNALFTVSSVVFYALEKMQYPSIIAVISKGLSVAIGALLLISGAGLVWVGVVVALESALNLLAGVAAVRRFLPQPISLSWDWETWRKLVREAYPFGLALILGQVYFTIDTVMLSVISGDAVTGWYNAAYRLVVSLLFLPTVCATVVFPILSRYFGVRREAYRRGVQRSFELMLLIACPVGLGLSVFSDRVIDLLYGEGFVESHLVLRIIGVAVVFLFVNYLAGMVLGSMNLQKLYFYGTGMAAALSVALNLILIPRYAHIGAAVASLATQASLFGLYAWILFRRGIAVFRLSLFVRVLGSTVVTLLVLRLLVDGRPLVLALAGVAVYGGALVMSRALTRDDLELLKQVVSGGRERG